MRGLKMSTQDENRPVSFRGLRVKKVMAVSSFAPITCAKGIHAADIENIYLPVGSYSLDFIFEGCVETYA